MDLKQSPFEVAKQKKKRDISVEQASFKKDDGAGGRKRSYGDCRSRKEDYPKRNNVRKTA